jgi:hypothetical protein
VATNFRTVLCGKTVKLTTKNVQGHTFPPDRQVFWHKGECKKVRTGKPDGLFCTRSEIPPVRYSADSCEGEQPEEEKALHPISLIQQEEKDFSLKKRSSLSVTIL